MKKKNRGIYKKIYKSKMSKEEAAKLVYEVLVKEIKKQVGVI
jgi:hypothetical protein